MFSGPIVGHVELPLWERSEKFFHASVFDRTPDAVFHEAEQRRKRAGLDPVTLSTQKLLRSMLHKRPEERATLDQVIHSLT